MTSSNNNQLLSIDRELKDISSKDIEYVKPIVDYSEARKRSVAMYRAVL